MKISTICFTLASLFINAKANAADVDSVRKLVEPKLGGAKIIEVRRVTPGLYEVATERDIVYTDSAAKFIFSGTLFDSTTKKNLTEARHSELNKISFSDLPLSDAIRTVRGNGKRVVAIFEDPNCGYCKKLRQKLESLDNVTIYTFAYNIFGEDSLQKSKNIWCSPDRAKAWDEWMLQNKSPVQASASCQTPNDRNLALGNRIRIKATPTLIFADGTRIPGAIEAKDIENKFTTINGN
jgi:thiol:disulfide interchange protein DsbC